jgi:hypothetical protein
MCVGYVIDPIGNSNVNSELTGWELSEATKRFEPRTTETRGRSSSHSSAIFIKLWSLNRIRYSGNVKYLSYEMSKLAHRCLFMKYMCTACRSQWVCGRSLAGIAGSNPAGSMDVCLL